MKEHCFLFLHQEQSKSTPQTAPFYEKMIFPAVKYPFKSSFFVPAGFEITKVEATDLDEPGNANSDINYKILNQDPQQPKGNMFEINPKSGVIRVNSDGLDREVRL